MKWEEGLSKTSIGRFGTFKKKEYFVDKNGFLCLNGMGLYIDLPLERDKFILLGHYNPPLDYLIKRSYDWVTIKNELQYLENNTLKTKVILYQTLLSPAFLYYSEFNCFRWVWDVANHGANAFALPLKDGIKAVPFSFNYQENKYGKLKEPWMLLWFSTTRNPFDTPLLLVFQHNPSDIRIITHEYLEIKFNGKAGFVAVMPLFGNELLDKKETVMWNKKLPEDVAKNCSKWSKILLKFPIYCKEEYKVDKKEKKVFIRNKVKFIDIKNDWGIKPETISPVPPILSKAFLSKYEVKFKQRIFSLNLNTKYGPLYGVKGDTLEYSLPICSYTEKTLAPVRVINDKKCEVLSGKLYKYLLNPYLTFGGDDTYNPEVLQDTLHNLRIMGWSIWSLDEYKRKKVLDSLARGLKNLKSTSYNHYVEPNNSLEYIADKTIFDTKGSVDYDFEWYNGMQLRGLWAYYFYCNRDKAIKLLKSKKDVIIKLLNYYSIYSDWAILCCWTCVRGIAAWIDGVNYAWEGLIGLNRIANDLNDNKMYNYTHYLVSKYTTTLYASWNMFLKSNKVCSGFYEREGLKIENHISEGMISATNVDLLLFLQDIGQKEKIRRYTYNIMPKIYPRWNLRYDKIFAKKGYPGEFKRCGRHYLLEPHLNVRSLLFNESLNKLLKYDKEMTGQVIECFLVGTHPMVIIPTHVKFKGNIWDDKLNIQTIILQGMVSGKFQIEIISKNKPLKFSGIRNLKYDKIKRKYIGEVNLQKDKEVKIKINYV